MEHTSSRIDGLAEFEKDVKAVIKKEANNRKELSISDSRPTDPKTLRIAQNSEAARKSSLRKKGTSGIRIGLQSISSEATVIDMDYARWIEEHHN